MAQSYINAAVSHMVEFLQAKATEQGITNLNVNSVFPELPRDNNNNLSASIKTPSIFVTFRLGAMEDTVGQLWGKTVHGDASYFRQWGSFEFDCFSVNQQEADQLAGWATFEIQKAKATELAAKGFQDFRITYSRPHHGFDYRVAWDFSELYYHLKVMRHLTYVQTCFDVVWVNEIENHGTITQIVFGEAEDFSIDMTIGMTLEYLYAEEKYYDFFNVIP